MTIGKQGGQPRKIKPLGGSLQNFHHLHLLLLLCHGHRLPSCFILSTPPLSKPGQAHQNHAKCCTFPFGAICYYAAYRQSLTVLHQRDCGGPGGNRTRVQQSFNSKSLQPLSPRCIVIHIDELCIYFLWHVWVMIVEPYFLTSASIFWRAISQVANELNSTVIGWGEDVAKSITRM